MNIVQRIGLYIAGGAVVGGVLTAAAKISVTAAKQRQGAIIGATCGLALALIRPLVSNSTLQPHHVAALDVALHVSVNAVALTAMQTSDLLNAPTLTLFGLIGSVSMIESVFVLYDSYGATAMR